MAGDRRRRRLPDPLLAQIGAALFWITVGWWLTVVVRVLGSLVRQGSSPTLLIENIDRWPEETVVAAVLSVLAALVLLLGPRAARPRRAGLGLGRRSPSSRSVSRSGASCRELLPRRLPPHPAVLSSPDGGAVASAFGLPDTARLEGPVARGQLGQVWRLDTSAGPYAVKEWFAEPELYDVARDADLVEAARRQGVTTPASCARRRAPSR